MSYDTWKTTEPDPNAFDTRCDGCANPVQHCTCPLQEDTDDPLAHDLQNVAMAVAGFIEEILKATDVNRALELRRQIAACIASFEAAEFAALAKANELCQ